MRGRRDCYTALDQARATVRLIEPASPAGGQ